MRESQYPEGDPALAVAAGAVRSHFLALFGHAPLVPLGNRGGFSGARLWRIEVAGGRFGLRAWPPSETLTRVQVRHRLMSRARGQGLSFVPAVVAASDGTTVVREAGRFWELTEWLPGHADFATHPSAARLAAACSALARLHAAWEEVAEPAAPCPAVLRRLEFLREWHDLLRSGWQPFAGLASTADPVRPVGERAWRWLPSLLTSLPVELERMAAGPWPLQPCLCDLWHDHLLFEGDRLTGIVDYGAVKVDHVAVDLSRLLGSLVGDDEQGWADGLRAYRVVRPLSTVEEELARVLDRSGTLIGAANWLRWLYHDGRSFEDRAAVARRLATLVDRIDHWRT
jgi:homoserine kinase type II